ncbi:MAG: hypothetical protein MUE51_09450 [Thermoleophilia bacterium]|nr:hypothetical protein [Thermoleophilia bacterium]
MSREDTHVEPNRIAVRIELAQPAALDPEDLVPVFHGWIRRGALEGVLIDVARYGHVHHGPGILLIGHEADHAIDLAGGRPSLLVTTKRGLDGTAADRLRAAVARALATAAALEAEPALGGRGRVRADAVTLRVLDRLAAPNEAATLAALGDDLEALAGDLWPDQEAGVQWLDEDPRAPFAVRLSVASDPGVAVVAASLHEAGAAVA